MKFHLKAPVNTETSVRLESLKSWKTEKKKSSTKKVMSFEVTGYKLGKKGLHYQQLNFSLYWRGMVICTSCSMEVLLFSLTMAMTMGTGGGWHWASVTCIESRICLLCYGFTSLLVEEGRTTASLITQSCSAWAQEALRLYKWNQFLSSEAIVSLQKYVLS